MYNASRPPPIPPPRWHRPQPRQAQRSEPDTADRTTRPGADGPVRGADGSVRGQPRRRSSQLHPARPRDLAVWCPANLAKRASLGRQVQDRVGTSVRHLCRTGAKRCRAGLQGVVPRTMRSAGHIMGAGEILVRKGPHEGRFLPRSTGPAWGEAEAASRPAFPGRWTGRDGRHVGAGAGGLTSGPGRAASRPGWDGSPHVGAGQGAGRSCRKWAPARKRALRTRRPCGGGGVHPRMRWGGRGGGEWRCAISAQ